MAAEDYKARLQRAMRRLHAAEARDLEGRRLDELAGRTLVRDLDVSGLATAIADILQEQRRDLVLHVGRLMKLAEVRQHNEDTRGANLHRRLTQIESEIRQLKRGSPR